MTKIFIISIISIISLSCESKKESCIRRYIDEQGYSYEQAKEMCDEAENDSYGRE